MRLLQYNNSSIFYQCTVYVKPAFLKWFLAYYYQDESSVIFVSIKLILYWFFWASTFRFHFRNPHFPTNHYNNWYSKDIMRPSSWLWILTYQFQKNKKFNFRLFPVYTSFQLHLYLHIFKKIFVAVMAKIPNKHIKMMSIC